ncbi:hypothetical protein C8R46DRAFT_1039997 [Mycena filopes]|nr:hypothetical protein C8R46DRAFT_1039997 [Mycena filopes]
MARIEKRWLALDQQLFVVTMVLNPYECLERFGDKASLNVFTLNSEVVALYRRIRSKPHPVPPAEGVEEAAEKAVSTAFMHYLQGTGDFASWKEHKQSFQEQHPDEPKLMWEQMKSCPATKALANFALLLLDLIANQASNERNFSDLKIKKTALRNHLGTKKLEKMSKVGASIRTENLEAGLVHERVARSVHDPTKVSGLLSVPRYADALEADDGDLTTRPEKMVKSAAAWRIEVAKWIREAREEEEDNDEDAASDTDTPAATSTRASGRVANRVPRARNDPR